MDTAHLGDRSADPASASRHDDNLPVQLHLAAPCLVRRLPRPLRAAGQGMITPWITPLMDGAVGVIVSRSKAGGEGVRGLIAWQ